MDDKKLKTLAMAKNQSISSSEETDSLPEDLPSSEKQRHMNPVKFVERAQELVMQQIISNANFGPSVSESKEKTKKKNKPALKQREEAIKKQNLKEEKKLSKGKLTTNLCFHFYNLYSNCNIKLFIDDKI